MIDLEKFVRLFEKCILKKLEGVHPTFILSLSQFINAQLAPK
jgi:hypothetical protein